MSQVLIVSYKVLKKKANNKGNQILKCKSTTFNYNNLKQM